MRFALVLALPFAFSGVMTPMKPTAMGPALVEAGLDPKNLPPIETLDKKQKLKVMKAMSQSLGIACVDCHAGTDFAADTRRKRAAKRMWNEMVRLTAFENGDPVFCDSCHQGRLLVLDRADKGKISDYMTDQYVARLKRTDGRDHDCSTCHGDPPEFKFVAMWKDHPAPDIKAHPARPAASAPAHAPAPAASTSEPAATTPAAPPKPKPAAAAPVVDKSCGNDKNNPCPLQLWMRANVASAVAANNTAALATALDKTAALVPDPSWKSWVDMSKAAAEAARKGDMAEARKSCQACHNEYKAKWRESYRTRPIK